MEKMEYNQKETKIEKGENVTIHALFLRHGEKKHDPNNPETALTQEGEIKSLEIGKTRTKKNMIKPYTSDTPRTQKTAELTIEGSPTENKWKIRKREELRFIYDKNGQFLKDVMEIKKDILGENFSDLDDDEKRKRMYEATIRQVNYYLNFGDKRPDPRTYSPIETASGIAKLVDKYIKMSEKLNSGSNVDLVNATHDFNLAAFLKETIVRETDGEKVRGFQSKDQNNISVKVLLRGEKFDTDMDRVKELVKIAKKLDEKKYDK